jgi:CRP-like cAMP-binding protein
MLDLLDIAINSETLKQFYPLADFNERELNYINARSSLNNMNKSEILFREGDNDSDVIYLIRGKIKLMATTGEEFILDAESSQSIYPIANLKPRRFSAMVHSENASVARIPANVIQKFIAKNSDDVIIAKNEIHHDTDSKIFDSDWMMAMVKTPLLKQLSNKHIEKLFLAMEEIKVRAGDTIISQGEEGDYFYMIKKGSCLVSRHNGSKEVALAELHPTESFGEEALLTDTQRNATIRMITNGRLVRINKLNFVRFLRNHMINWVDPDQVNDILNNGAIKIDLTENAWLDTKIDNAIRISPLMLRTQMRTLSRGKSYLLLCDNDNNNALASYLLRMRGIKSYALRGGAESLVFC